VARRRRPGAAAAQAEPTSTRILVLFWLLLRHTHSWVLSCSRRRSRRLRGLPRWVCDTAAIRGKGHLARAILCSRLWTRGCIWLLHVTHSVNRRGDRSTGNRVRLAAKCLVALHARLGPTSFTGGGLAPRSVATCSTEISSVLQTLLSSYDCTIASLQNGAGLTSALLTPGRGEGPVETHCCWRVPAHSTAV
jgi:hypothetical protein